MMEPGGSECIAGRYGHKRMGDIPAGGCHGVPGFFHCTYIMFRVQ